MNVSFSFCLVLSARPLFWPVCSLWFSFFERDLRPVWLLLCPGYLLVRPPALSPARLSVSLPPCLPVLCCAVLSSTRRIRMRSTVLRWRRSIGARLTLQRWAPPASIPPARSGTWRWDATIPNARGQMQTGAIWQYTLIKRYQSYTSKYTDVGDACACRSQTVPLFCVLLSLFSFYFSASNIGSLLVRKDDQACWTNWK